MTDIISMIADRQSSFESFVKGSGDRLSVPSRFNYAHVIGKDILGYTDQDSTVVRDQIDQRKMAVPCKITTLSMDRDGDVVVPDGCRSTLSQYEINPQILLAHGGAGPFPVGKARENRESPLRVEIFPEYVLSWCYFNCRTKQSEETFHLVINDDINMASIGFAPVDAERLRPSKAHHNGPGTPQGWLFRTWTLLEWSWVIVPSNPFAEAVRRYISRGYITGGGQISDTMKSALAPYAEKAKVWEHGHDFGNGREAFAVNERWKDYAPAIEAKAIAYGGPRKHDIADDVGYLHDDEYLDVSNQKLRPSQIIYNWVSRYFDCPIKDIVQNDDLIPRARMGSFLMGLQKVIGSNAREEVRNIKRDGSESPPIFQTIQLNSKQKHDFLMEGTAFYRGDICKFVMRHSLDWMGRLQLSVYTRAEHAEFNAGLLEKSWTLAKANNYLKGEAFSLSGDFLEKTDETWDDVFLSEKNRSACQRIVKQLNQKGENMPSYGALFVGDPGNGKTLVSRIIRNLTPSTFIWVSSRDFQESGSFYGLADGFALARELAPSVLCIEDVDNWLDKYTIDLMKTEMDGVVKSRGVLTIVTTNFPERLPQALIDRPGRFHDVLLFNPPDAKARTEMLKKWMKELPASATSTTVTKTEGYSGAHVYHLAAFAKTLQEQDGLTPTDAIQQALKKIDEQRDLIDQIQLNGSNYETPRARIRREGSTVVSKKWNKAPRHKDPMVEAVGADGGNLVEDKANPNQDVQCVYVPKKVAPTLGDAKRWLESHSFHANDVSESKDEPDFWKAEQFEKKLCSGELVEEELADGAKGFLCQPKGVEKPEAPEESVKRVYSVIEKAGDYERHIGFATHDEMMRYLETKCGGKPCDCNGGKNMATAKTRKEMEDEEKDEELVSDDDATVKDEELVSDDDATVKDDEEEEEKDLMTDGTDANLPHGAEMTRDVAEHFSLLRNYLDKMLPLLEEEDMKSFFGEELVAACEGVMEKLSELAREKYAEHKEELGEHLKMDEPVTHDDEELAEELEGTVNDDAEEDEEEAKEDDIDQNGNGFQADSEGLDNDAEADALEGEDEEEEESKGKKSLKNFANKGRRAILVKRLNKRNKNIVKEAAEHLEHAASHDYGDVDEKTHKMMKGAHLYHADQLKSMLSDMANDVERRPESEDNELVSDDDANVKDEELVSEDDATVKDDMDGDTDEMTEDEAKEYEALISQLEREVERNATAKG